MGETVPVLAGVVAALAGTWLPAHNIKFELMIVLAALVGLTWSGLSGELAVSWYYGVVDAAQAVAAALIVQWAAARWRDTADSTRLPR